MACPARRSGCPISFALDVFGDRWTLLVLRDLLFVGKTRFTEFHASPEGIATNVLSDRLKTLEEEGILERTADPEDRRRVLYRATERGLDLLPALVELIRWGARHDSQTRMPKKILARIESDQAGFIREVQERHRAGADDAAATAGEAEGGAGS